MVASHQYLIALGSNLGDRAALLQEAVTAIKRRVGEVVAQAPVFATAPMGAADQMFLNSALTVRSELRPEDALRTLLQIEADLGRVRAERWGNRSIDLDLILWLRRDAGGAWQAATWESDTLILPHRELLNRDFVLVPAAMIAPTWVHPMTGKTLAEERAERGYVLALSDQ